MKITDEMIYQNITEARNLWLETMPQQREHQFSDSFETKMTLLIEKSFKRTKFLQSFKQAAVAAACFIFVAVGIIKYFPSACANFVSAIEIIKTAISETETMIYYKFHPQTIYVLPDIEFRYLPQGYTEVQREETLTNRLIQFQNDSNDTIRFFQSSAVARGNGVLVWDTENVDSSEIQIGNITATFIKKDGRTSVYWFTPTSLFELDSTLTDEEIVTIIQNLMVYDN